MSSKGPLERRINPAVTVHSEPLERLTLICWFEMTEHNAYNDAHLMVAAIRVLDHQSKAPPSLDAVCQLLSFSAEHGHLVCRKLQALEIVKLVEGAFGTRLFIVDHQKIEEIPRDEAQDKLAEALEAFQASRTDFSKKIESFKAQQEAKKKDLFADIEKKLKNGLGPKK